MDTDPAVFFLVVANAGVLVFLVLLVLVITKPWRKTKIRKIEQDTGENA